MKITAEKLLRNGSNGYFTIFYTKKEGNNLKINLCLAAVIFVLFCGFNASVGSGEIDRKTEIETFATLEVEAEYYELAGLCKQYFGICMETLCLYGKYQKEIGVSVDEMNELKKETADLPDKIEYFLNKPDSLDKEINDLDFNNAEECQYALGILKKMSVTLKDSIVQFKAQITVKNGALREIKKKIIVPEIKERFVVIKKETDNLVAIQDNLAGIYDELLCLIIEHQGELGTSIEEIEYYQKIIQDLPIFNDDLRKESSVLENKINTLNPERYEECVAFMGYLEKYLMFIRKHEILVGEEMTEAVTRLESLKQHLGGGSCPNE